MTLTTSDTVKLPSFRDIAWDLFLNHALTVETSKDLQAVLAAMDGREIRVVRNAREVSLDDWAEVRYCIHGHALIDGNGYLRPDGYLECRACRLQSNRESYRRKRARGLRR